MTDQELRRLDAWLAEHLMEYSEGPNMWRVDSSTSRNFHPTILAADAMDVLKKCAEKCPHVSISKYPPNWIVGSHALGNPAKESTLELAICLFAKQLFSQTTK